MINAKSLAQETFKPTLQKGNIHLFKFTYITSINVSHPFRLKFYIRFKIKININRKYLFYISLIN